MRSLAVLLLSLLAAVAHPAAAQAVAYEVIEDVVTVDEVPPVGQAAPAGSSGGSERFVFVQTASAPAPIPAGLASYGPFRVIDASHAALVDVTGSGAPAAFAAMLKAWPGIATLSLVDCPGTEDDRANLRLGRMIRERGIATEVPAGGFVASGAVELFLAGTRRSAAPSAQFAVHSWADEDGREAKDYAADAPENRAYIDYYQRMGMTAAEAAAFYAMTNAAPFARPQRLTAADIGRWVKLDAQQPFVLAASDVTREEDFGKVAATLSSAIPLDSAAALN